MIELNTILADTGLDPARVLVMRHQPYEPALRKIFPAIALEARHLFNAYQSAHNPKTESALAKASHLASFIADGSGKALFVGLYDVVGHRTVDREQWLAIPENRALIDLGMLTWVEKGRDSAKWFNLPSRELYQNWSGKLVVGWPPPDRSWYRWADRNIFPVISIHEENVLERPALSWDQLVLSWAELSVLSRRIREGLAQWRGIYLITDTTDGARYVGSAYGADNLLGRWQNYAKSGHGGNKLLRLRDPRNFSFSILQRVSPDLPAEEVIAIEASWKLRLSTRAPSGLNEN